MEKDNKRGYKQNKKNLKCGDCNKKGHKYENYWITDQKRSLMILKEEIRELQARGHLSKEITDLVDAKISKQGATKDRKANTEDSPDSESPKARQITVSAITDFTDVGEFQESSCKGHT